MQKKILLLFIAIGIFSLLSAQIDPMKYARIYTDCVDDVESTIVGGTYGEYPKTLIDAIFPGGQVELIRYIAANTEVVEVYNGEKDAEGRPLLVTGEVMIEFVIDRCGKPGRFNIVQSLTEEQDAEAMRIIEGLPIFKPALIDGYRVKCAYIAPVPFLRKLVPQRPSDDDDAWDESWGDQDEWEDSDDDDDDYNDDSYDDSSSDESWDDDDWGDDSDDDDWDDDDWDDEGDDDDWDDDDW